MKRLNTMIILIICVTFLLVINTSAVFNYRDSVLSCETRKDSMLNFVIKYETLANSLRSNARQYIEHRDDQYLTQFNELLNNYTDKDHISLGYRTFTTLQAKEQLDYIDPSKDFTLKAQAQFLQFTPAENALYQDFLSSYTVLLELLAQSIQSEDTALLSSLKLTELHVAQQELVNDLSRNYIERLNAKEDSVVATQNMTELSLLCLCFLLLIVVGILFCFLLKENKWNSYFRKLYTTVVENVNVGLSIMNQSGEYEYMNAKYRDILAVDKINPIGKTQAQVFDRDVNTALSIIPNLNTVRSEGQLRVTINHVEKYVDYDHFTIYDENNQKKFIYLLHDMTQTEQMQCQLKKQLREIEFYSHAKDSFLANMSHEIKTPINAILGMTYFLKETQLSKKQQDLAEKIESSSDVLLAIINDVLDLSKIKSKNMTLYPTAFYLSDVIHSIEDMFVAQIKSKGLDWFCESNFVPDLCLNLDRTRLIQVLVNIVNNACKFTEQGYISLSIETKSETSNRVYLEFCVEDTGIGIDRLDIAKLFQEFEQLENHLTKQHTGTGLGLSICKHIVETMGGRMWVTSEIGIGSNFYFTIPAPKADGDEVKNLTGASAEITSFDGTGAKVLIVEDTEINLEIAENLLTNMNVSCDTATNGLESLALCRNKPANYYRVILMDIHMPEMDGYTAADILKNEMGITSPIIALTATEVDDETGLRHRDAINGFILKPFKVETFYKTLSKYFANATDQVGYVSGVRSDGTAPETLADGPFSGKTIAIHNLGGMESIYYKHVAKFKANYPQSPSQVLALLEKGDNEEARRQIHSIKGLAGTLGMLELQKSAYNLEKKIAEGETKRIPAAMEQFKTALAEVISTEP